MNQGTKVVDAKETIMPYNEWDTDKDGKLSSEERANMDYFINEMSKDVTHDQHVQKPAGSGRSESRTLLLVGLLILGGAVVQVFPGIGIIIFLILIYLWLH